MTKTLELRNWYEEYKKEKIKIGINEGNFSQEHTVYCPHCGIEQMDWWESISNKIEEWEELDCDKCEKTFKVKKEIVYSTKR
jgi:hypothetical protein